MYSVGFHFNRYKLTTGIKPVLLDYSWWMDLVHRVSPQADQFELRCWSDESEAIDTGLQFGNQIDNTETNELVFRGPISEAFLAYVCENGFDDDGSLKWFTLNFYCRDTLLFHSGHYGTEPFAFVSTQEEAQQLQAWSKQYPIISRVDVYSG